MGLGHAVAVLFIILPNTISGTSFHPRHEPFPMAGFTGREKRNIVNLTDVHSRDTNMDDHSAVEIYEDKLFDNMSKKERSHIITTTFSPTMSINRWFRIFDMLYRQILADCINVACIQKMKAYAATEVQPNNIIYVDPSPVGNSEDFLVSIIVTKTEKINEDNKGIPLEIVWGCVENKTLIETVLNWHIKTVEKGYPQKKLASFKKQPDNFMILIITLLTVTCGCVVLITIWLSVTKFQSKTAKYEPPAGLSSEVFPGDQNCGQYTLRRSQFRRHEASVNANQEQTTDIDDHKNWVVPFNELYLSSFRKKVSDEAKLHNVQV